MSRMHPVAIAAFVALVGTIAAPVQAAREIYVDQGDNYAFSGQKWDFPGSAYDPTDTNIGVIPFALNFGAGPTSYQFRYDPHGQVVLLTDTGVPTGSSISPLFSASTLFQPDNNGGGLMVWGAGQIDPQLLLPTAPINPVYDINDALTAYRFSWVNVCPSTGACDGTDSVSFQAVLIDRSNGDFDILFNYGNSQGTIPADAIGGFELGANTTSFSSFTSPGPDFCFRGGVVASCSAVVTPTVPEPGTGALFALGLLLLSRMTPRRRLAVARRRD